MTYPAKENELSRKSKNMNTKLPKQLDNKDYGKKRKAKLHKFNVVDTKTNNLYWSPAIAESFSSFLIQEATTASYVDKLTALPDMVVSELKKLIRSGAKDLNQSWENACHLVDTAYHVANIKRPNPTQKGAWKQYESLLKVGVHALYDAKGTGNNWRSSDIMFGESLNYIEGMIKESSDRFFVKIPGRMDVEVEADNMSEVIRDLTNKIRRHGASTEVVHRDENGAVVQVLRNGEVVEEIVIQQC